MKQIVPGLYAFTGLMMGRVYLIEDPDGLTIIDAGLHNAAAQNSPSSYRRRGARPQT